MDTQSMLGNGQRPSRDTPAVACPQPTAGPGTRTVAQAGPRDTPPAASPGPRSAPSPGSHAHFLPGGGETCPGPETPAALRAGSAHQDPEPEASEEGGRGGGRGGKGRGGGEGRGRLGLLLGLPVPARQGCLAPKPTQVCLKDRGLGRHEAAKDAGHRALQGQRPS